MEETFESIARDPAAYGRAWKEHHPQQKAVGYVCSYVPEEMIWAAGALPFRIFGSVADHSPADAHLQSYCCSLVRGILSEGLAGSLEFLDGIVFAHTCDSMQRLSDIWRLNLRAQFHLDLVMPVKLNTASAREYMVDILQRFKAGLEAQLGARIGDDALREAIRLANRIRRNLMRIWQRGQNPAAAVDLYALSRAAMVMDRRLLDQRLARLADDLDAQGAPPAPTAKRLVLAGSVLCQPAIYRVVAASGGRVVWDDLCTGGRFFEGEVAEDGGDPLAALADRYLARVECPAKHMGIHSRGEDLLRKVKAHGAQGVIFAHLKFCDPHAFDYPYLKSMLDKEGVPCLLFELDEPIASEGQLQTRCEAFLEML